MTLVAALTSQSLQAAMTVSGAVNGNIFAAYLGQVIGPTLVPGDVVVLDNLPAHKVAGLAQLVEARGARLLYLPPTRPISIPLNSLSVSSKPGYVRPRPAPARPWRQSFKRPSNGLLKPTQKTGLTIVATMYSNLRNALVISL